ncbi:1,4-alpha-glucan branching protein [Streptomyces sp. N2-109]|uniref:1,4-alpha-glucan branching protein n=1 Tax=Streptomyces gossypii TaxID=2883101 RepID=A0ABT2JVA8_9ACTN|nr:1,4-alpha-glucan branching protein [Streptomyces gossypii]MCT2591825.1 1,4-alpha-glucan branching protein [Streptomyces gossypii]
MAFVYNTTVTPSKLELLTSWLPGQSWYLGKGGEPSLTKVGGFRLDDPQGEVGLEFMVVTDDSGGQRHTYQVPFSYRGAPLDEAGHALIGTTEHGVLGTRWVYDGIHDPVLIAQLFALLTGEAEPQSQGLSDTPDFTVTGYFAGTGRPVVITPATVTNGPDGTDLLVRTTSGAATPGTPPNGQLTIRVHRVLQDTQGDASDPAGPSDPAVGHVTANWLLPDGSHARGRFAVVHNAPPE